MPCKKITTRIELSRKLDYYLSQVTTACAQIDMWFDLVEMHQATIHRKQSTFFEIFAPIYTPFSTLSIFLSVIFSYRTKNNKSFQCPINIVLSFKTRIVILLILCYQHHVIKAIFTDMIEIIRMKRRRLLLFTHLYSQGKVLRRKLLQEFRVQNWYLAITSSVIFSERLCSQ